ncbi:TetR/AcrR family transcriptional regulator [Mycobacterium sp. URHB0021]
MSSDSTPITTRSAASRWTAREAELLAVTLRLLQQHGYDRLTVEAVANEAKSSKATIYRRWPSKVELVLAAFIEGTCVELVPPCTGSLRSDLLHIGAAVCEHARRHASTMSAVMTEISHSPALSAALQDEFVHQRKLLITEVLADAAGRGEIDAAAIHDELWDVLPGYLVFRSLIPGRPPTEDTVRALVDDVLMPSLTRTRIAAR